MSKTIDGIKEPENIANHFQNIYNNLYNSVPSEDKVTNILNTLNEKISDDE